MRLAVLDSGINELGVFGLLRRSEDQGGVGGSILGLVLRDGSEVTRVADDSARGDCIVSTMPLRVCARRKVASRDYLRPSPADAGLLAVDMGVNLRASGFELV